MKRVVIGGLLMLGACGGGVVGSGSSGEGGEGGAGGRDGGAESGGSVGTIEPPCNLDCVGPLCTIPVCQDGKCVVAKVPDGTTCGAGFVCADGACVQGN